MPKCYLYLRVSSLSQDLENQRQSLLDKYDKLGLTHERVWIEEKVTGKRHFKKRDLNKVLKEGKPGDVLLAYHIDRLGRNKDEIFQFIGECKIRKITIYYSLMDLKNDGSISDSVMETVFGLIADIENKLKSARVKAGLQQAKKEGREGGRKEGQLKQKLEKDILDIKKKVDGGIKSKALAQQYNVTENTISRLIKRHKLRETPYEELEKNFTALWAEEKKKKEDQALARHKRIEERKNKPVEVKQEEIK